MTLAISRLRRSTTSLGVSERTISPDHVRDSGLVHALLGLSSLHDLAGHPVCGHSYEGFCIDNLMAVASPHCRSYTYRTQAGAEIDLLIERAGQPWMAI